MSAPIAPAWQVQEWLNSPPVELAALRGRVVVVVAFQMLCPGCVSRALPQAARVHALFPRERVEVLGLHTVFEHHEAMSPLALRAFLHEYRVPFPVGIDRPTEPGPIPATMQAYGMRGTPTLLLIDAQGRLRRQFFGEIDDLRLGAEIMALIGEAAPSPDETSSAGGTGTADAPAPCSDEGCAVPGTP